MDIDTILVFQELTVPQTPHTAPPERSQPTSCQGHSPLVVCQLLLQQKHLGLELVPLMQHVPQLLQRESGAVGVLEIHGQLLCL